MSDSFGMIKKLDELATGTVLVEALEGNGGLDQILAEDSNADNWSEEKTGEQLLQELGI